MNEITAAITARHAQIKQFQADIEVLQRAASVLGGKTRTTAKAASQPKATAKPKPKAKPKAQGKRHQWSAAQKAAVGKRMKAYWAKRRKASAPAAASPAQPTATQKRKRAPMSAAAKKAMSKRLKAYWAKRKQ